MAKNKTLLRLLAVLAAIGLAIYAQSTIVGGSLAPNTLYYFIAAIVLMGLSGWGETALPTLTTNVAQFERIGKRQILMWLLAGACLLGSTVLFAQNSNREAWLLHVVGMIVFALAFVPMTNLLTRLRAQKLSRDAWLSLVLFGFVVFVATYARTYALREFPEGVWFDEGANGSVSRQILNDPNFWPIYIDISQLPAHFNYLMAVSLRLFGDDIGGVRMVPTLFGIMAVAFTFLLLRRWFNTPVAFAGAMMFAVMRWSLTFSRFGVNGHANSAFMVASLYFIDRAIRQRRLLDAALAGLCIGMGLNFYYAFRLYAAGVVAFGLAWPLLLLVLRLVNRQSPKPPLAIGALLRIWAVPILVATFGVMIAIAPIAQFAAKDPKAFFERTNTVSIFTKRDEPDLLKALEKNITKHVLMFNVRGDGNGRHNIPGQPMLDPLMAALGVLGLGYAALHAHRARNLFMVGLLFAMMLGGIFSLDFEAPQGYRTNGVYFPVVYFATLPLAAALQASRQLALSHIAKKAAYGAALAGVGGLLWLIGQSNLDTFFNKQRYATDAWSVQSTSETFAGREMNRLAETHDLVVSSMFAGHPSVRFIAPNVTNYKVFNPNDVLVLGNPNNRGVAYLLDTGLESLYNQLQKYFPKAEIRELVPPRGGGPLAYSVAISPEDIQQILGVSAKLYRNGFDGAVEKEFSLTRLAADWSAAAAPMTGAFQAEFRSTLYVPQPGSYRFAVKGVSDAEIFVDEFAATNALNLGKGNHALRVRVPNANRAFELTWQQGNAAAQSIPQNALLRHPVSNNGLLGAYYRNGNWSGEPAFSQLDPEIAFYFHNLPLPRPYSVEWKGKVYAPRRGDYIFTTQSIDESILSIGGKVLIDNRQSGAFVDGRVTLDKGWHEVNLRFADRTSYTRVYLYWTPPGGAREVLPARYLLPPQGAYPSNDDMDKQLAEATRLISQNKKQVTALDLLDGQGVLPPAPTPAPIVAPPKPAATSGATFVPVIKAPLPNLPKLGDLSLKPQAVVGGEGSADNQFKQPNGVAVAKDGRVYVADMGNKRVQILNGSGQFVGKLTLENPPFSEPIDVAIDQNGMIYVLDSDIGFIAKFDSAGKLVGNVDLGRAGVYKPRGFYVDEQGQIYLANTGGGNIVKISQDGTVLQTYGQRGADAGQFNEPNDVKVSPQGLVFATDSAKGRINVFLVDGRFALEIPIPAANALVGTRVLIAPDGAMLWTATEPHELRRATQAGQSLGQWGGFGQGLGQLRQPTGIAVSPDGKTLWLVDSGNHRVQQWAIEK
ncbi:MAG: PA14 domain-containing protein [Anaerolineae bacterium]|nr:PA14 domain-containing protein [Anaerolineae bacterium]